MEDRFRKYEPFFGKWKVSRELGHGTFGRVYEIYWEDDLGGRSVSALKVMHIPSDQELHKQIAIQPNMEAVRNYFFRKVERIKEEIRILQNCKGHSNIVSYEDHMIVEDKGENKIGWDILIRMELLYPLGPHFSRKEATQYDVIQMWLDIANALKYCDEQNIIHRDIKPANILISKDGRYKLSDFGTARKLQQQDENMMTMAGTKSYMAPEVLKSEKYDKRADYYSLGYVIYYFLNRRRHVFLPPYPQEINEEDDALAEKKRINGEKIPEIRGVSKEINNTLRKSMAYRPANRYKNAAELYRAIEHILKTQGNELRQRRLNDDKPAGTFSKKSVIGGSKGSGDDPGGEGTSKQTGAIVAACVLLLAGVGGILYGLNQKNGQEQQGNAGVRSESGSVSVSGKLSGTEPTEVAQSGPENGPEAGIRIETEPGTKTKPEPETVTEAEPGTRPEPETKTESESGAEEKAEGKTTEAVTEAATQAATEAVTEAATQAVTEAVTEAATQTATEATTEAATQAVTEAGAETAAQAGTEAPTQTATEAVTEASTQATEAVTEAVSETETETETEPITEAPIPTALALGELERPRDGDSVDKELGIKGWVLTNSDIGDIDIYADLMADGSVVESVLLDQKAMGEKSFEKRREKYAAEIAAGTGYEIRTSQSVEDIPAGDYELNLRAAGQNGDWEEILQTTDIRITGESRKSNGDVLDFMGLTDETEALDTHYLYEEKNLAIGMDVEDKDTVLTQNAAQILLTGWVNADSGTSLGMYLEIDSQLYTADTLAQQGGEFVITRVPRNLEKMDAALVGSAVRNMDEAGIIISLKLPFLDAGFHTVAVSFNVGVPGMEPETVDISPLTIQIDPSVPVEEEAAERIAASWEDEFPQPETQTKESMEQETGE